jgi:hypothetical protein
MNLIVKGKMVMRYAFAKAEQNYHIKMRSFKPTLKTFTKYHRNTIFSKFAIIGTTCTWFSSSSDSVTDIKTFKWLIKENELQVWWTNQQRATSTVIQQIRVPMVLLADNQRASVIIAFILGCFVENCGGDLTIKEDNIGDDGQGIYLKM